MAGQGRIDVHHRFVPPPFATALARRGIDKVAGAPLPLLTPELRAGIGRDNVLKLLPALAG